MLPGAIKWCNICNAKPAAGVLSLYSKSTKETVDYDACKECVDKIVEGKIDWIQNGL